MDILVIDDEATLRRTLRTTLESMGHAVADAATADTALSVLRGQPFDLALLDLRLGRQQGMDFLPQMLREAPNLAVVVMTAYATISSAVEAMRGGAFDYLPKPFTPDQLRVVLERWENLHQLRSRLADLEEQVHAAVPEADLHTAEPAMQQALDLVFKAAASDATILLRGESGTGKGVLARAIHVRSPRAAAPFVMVHCPSLSAELLESELFGHARGAFTGAVRDAPGKVTAAEGGTLFLDEIGDLPMTLQPKLLRLLQDRAFERIGETRTRRSNIRVVAATNRDLLAEVAAGNFREDLYYRLNVIDVELLPLRKRPGDILPLARHLLGFFARQNNKAVTGFTGDAEVALRRHNWPGNVRELRNAVERGVILTPGPMIDVADLPAGIGRTPTAKVEVGAALTLEALETEHIRRVLTASSTVEEAATILGIDPSTLFRKRKRYGL